MKAKSIVHPEGKLPEPPLEVVDLPEVSPTIGQDELLAYVNAKHRYQIARADYEMKGAALTLRLLQLCQPEPGDISASLEDDDDRLVVIDANTE